MLGKRRRDNDDASSSDSDVPEDVKRIPMPRDTPPPIPKDILDEWYAKRRARRAANGNANHEPLGDGKGERRGQRPSEPPAAPVEVKTVYEAKAVVRDLKKEAVSAFMPAAVRMKIEKGKGQGGLLEPEEADRLEKEGYLRPQGVPGSEETKASPQQNSTSRRAMVEDAEDEDD